MFQFLQFGSGGAKGRFFGGKHGVGAKIKHGRKMSVIPNKLGQLILFHITDFGNRESLVAVKGIFL